MDRSMHQGTQWTHTVNKQHTAVVRRATWLRGKAEDSACLSDNLRREICN